MRQMIVTATLLLGLSASTMAAQVYKWVDERGVTHFSATPPAGQSATTVSPNITQPKAQPAPAAADTGEDKEQTAIDKKVKADVAEQEAQRQQYCERARTNLAQLQNNPRLRIESEGEVRRIDEDERQSRIEKLKTDIAENCR